MGETAPLPPAFCPLTPAPNPTANLLPHPISVILTRPIEKSQLYGLSKRPFEALDIVLENGLDFSFASEGYVARG